MILPSRSDGAPLMRPPSLKMRDNLGVRREGIYASVEHPSEQIEKHHDPGLTLLPGSQIEDGHSHWANHTTNQGRRYPRLGNLVTSHALTKTQQ